MIDSKTLENDELFKAALAKAANDDERAKIRAQAYKMLDTFLAIAQQFKKEQVQDE